MNLKWSECGSSHDTCTCEGTRARRERLLVGPRLLTPAALRSDAHSPAVRPTRSCFFVSVCADMRGPPGTEFSRVWRVRQSECCGLDGVSDWDADITFEL